MTSVPLTLVSLVDLDEASRATIEQRFGAVTMEVRARDHGTIMRELEASAPVGTLVVVADGLTSAAVSELDRYARRFDRAVLIAPAHADAPREWTGEVDQL